jgi:hypothetical protein
LRAAIPRIRAWGGLDDRVGRQGRVLEAATGVESVVQASQAADGANSERFAADFVGEKKGDGTNHETSSK